MNDTNFGFDFSKIETLTNSKNGKFFNFMGMNGEELKAGAVLLGADSEEFKRADFSVSQELIKLKNGKSEIEEYQFNDYEKTEKVLACCLELRGCYLSGADYSGNDKEKIREFFTLLPQMRDQMYNRIANRESFLSDAAIAG